MVVNLRLERVIIFLFVAGLVAMLTRRMRIPYTVGLVFTGLLLSLHPLFSEVPFTKDLIFKALLPPLVFEAALQIRWKDLRTELPVVLVLATIGVCISWGVTAVSMRYFVGWEWVGALLFGILIAATDPVSVIATFKEAGVHGRLRLLVEAESLLNDATAAVGFGIVLLFASGATLSIIDITKSFIFTAGGGIICGALAAGIVILLTRRTNDNLIEIVFTVFAAYASFLFAEQFHFSGILASLTAGLIWGNFGSFELTSSKERVAVTAFWEYQGFLVNTLIFIIIGIHLSLQKFADLLVPTIIAVFVVILGRMLAVYLCCAAFKRTGLRVENRHQHVLFWGGLRGALALALAVGMPSTIPNRDMIVSVAFAVVAFSVFAQGLTMTPLLRRLREIPNKGLNENT